jgi:UDP-N-acetylglucosamine 2-epimerase (non-hydrolysing)/UDP-GlcNAc3NAcA epimerase
MSDVFFEEMDIPKPNYNLGISGGTHGQMTGQMLIKIEEVLLKEQPEMLLVFGDTNSTMAAALAAVKLHIPVCHVEAGNRLGTYENPEEINRIVTDHVSSLHLVCTASGVEFLKREGFSDSVHLVGDPMYDAFRYYTDRLDGSELTELTDFAGNPVPVPEEFYYMTCHRQENTDTDEKLDQIFQAMETLEAPVIYPVHPRNHTRAERLQRSGGYRNIILTSPVGYKTSISLVNHAKKIVTDSGGLQREAFFAGKPCVTVSDYIAWPEIMVKNYNQLAKPDKMDILEKLSVPVTFDPAYQPFGDGHSAEKIVEKIKEFLH